MQADGRALLKGACGAVGRRRKPDVASQARWGRASLTVGGRAERCGGGGRWAVAARVWV
jgi:hypothetical protein